MTAASRKPGRRYSRESQQEDRSEGQIRERFAELGWPCDRLGRDLGEDLHVRIYDDGRSTGLSFLVQLKSAADTERLKRKKSPALAYRLDVKDLLHWEDSTTQVVVLVLWDVAKRSGWWRSVPEIVTELDKAGKSWRKKKTVTATVPLANVTDEEGVSRLRWVVADHSLRLRPRKDMTVSLSFPRTEQGERGRLALERALDLGESITFSREFIPTVTPPIWLRRAYGEIGPGETIRVEISPALSKNARAIRIEVESPEGPSACPFVELRTIVQGRKRVKLTNEHQKLPIVFSLDFGPHGVAFELQQAHVGNTVHEARDAAAFMLAAGCPGSVIRIISLEDGAEISRFDSARAGPNYDLAEMRRWRDVLDKLCFIQLRLAGRGNISSRALRKMSAEDVDTTASLFRILRDGRLETVETLPVEAEPSADPLPEVPCSVRFDIGEVRCQILDLDIILGAVRGSIVDADRYMATVRAAQVKARTTGKTVSTQVANVRVIREYLDWLPGNHPWAALYETLDHLAEQAGPHDGYFTRADARAAGASDTIFEALLAERKIEPVASGVYRLVHFPRSDHEELVTLWLQTDRRGVVSHDSALLLHELSDVLPARRHVTVPSDWEAGDATLGPDVDVHRGEVAERELRWIGPVPYTAPLRTVRDCIDDHLSPDLLEQAIAQGLRRRLFKIDDLPPTERAGAA
jgi:hypothetical protein